MIDDSRSSNHHGRYVCNSTKIKIGGKINTNVVRPINENFLPIHMFLYNMQLQKNWRYCYSDYKRGWI